MKKLMICGGHPLHGQVTVGGFKNAALPVLFATILIGGRSQISNLPLIRDVSKTLKILEAIGAHVRMVDTHTVEVDTSEVRPCAAPDVLASAFRASSYLLGAELGRFGRSRVAIPGGCRIGARPLDLHLYALTALGADAMVGEGAISAECRALHGGEIVFPTPSVGATVNAILAATLAEGVTHIKGAAREPHIEELAAFLNAAGADISGAGEETICVKGVSSLAGVGHRLMPDMIEAGTFLTSVGAAGGEIVLLGAEPAHLRSLLVPLERMGVSVVQEGEALIATRDGALAPICAVAEPYPGLPTDLHPQLAALSCFAEGVSHIRDAVFPDRFAYTNELMRMGADILLEGGRVRVRGGPLHGARVRAHDLRAGAALAVAALGAEGRTLISGVDILERGYESFPEKLSSLGAAVQVK